MQPVTDPAPTHFYRAFGLTIRSEIELLELDETAPTKTPDVILALGPVDRTDPEMPGGRIHAFDEREQYLGFAQIGKYLIRDGRDVTYDHWPTLPLDFAGYSFLGPVMAMLLHRRQYLILHGAALAIDGEAVLFLGDKGAGKSTTAGATIAAGHQLVTDDLIAVTIGDDGRHMVQIGYPSIKVTSAALAAYDCDDLTELTEEIEGFPKRRARLNRPQPAAPVPIARIFLLERGAADADPEIERIAPDEALPAIFEHSYMARYGRDAFSTPQALTAHFNQCGALVRDVGVARLRVPDAIDRLPQTIALVEADVRHTPEPGGI